MIYFSYSFQFLSFAAGMVTLFIAIQLFNQYKFKYLKSNIYLLIAYILLMLFNSVGSILDFTDSNVNTPDSFSIYNQILFFIVPLILMFLVYHFRIVFDGIMGRGNNKKFKMLIVIIVATFLVLHLLFKIFDKYLPFYLAPLILLLIQVIFFGMIFNILKIFKKYINKVEVESWKYWLNFIYFMEFIYFIVLGLLIIASIMEIFSHNILMMITSFMALIINPLSIFLFVKYHKIRYEIIDKNFDELIKYHNITERESEIIKFVCEGKTNKEIAEKIFLSPLTVRDHLSNIYKKTHVNNRLKLSNIFK